jgi:hypothetical protein
MGERTTTGWASGDGLGLQEWAEDEEEDRTLNTMVMDKIATTTPSEMATGILKTSIRHIFVPMKTRMTAKP